MSITVRTSTTMSPTAARGHAAHDRLFYGGMAVALAITAFSGFSRTYYFRMLDGGPLHTVSGGPVTSVVHLHSALFTAWVILFVVQTALISARRVAVHRRLGILGAVLAAGMVAAGGMTAIAAARRGSGGAAGLDPLAFMAIPLFDLVLFSTFVIAALLRRRDKEAHKRLMLLAYISIITAAIARLPGIAGRNPLIFFGLEFLFLIAAMIYDLRSRGRVHRAYLWGGAFILALVPLRLAVMGTSAWHAFAAFLVR